MRHEELIQELFRVQAVKFGSFILKSGASSPVYIDLRTALTYPAILKEMASEMLGISQDLNFDYIVGVPYTAWPLATSLSLLSGKPMLLKRKETKAYGTQTALHGNFQAGESCLVVEDVVTTGGSILETIEGLEEHGLRVSHVCCFLNREQGAEEALGKRGYTLKSVLTLQEVLDANVH